MKGTPMATDLKAASEHHICGRFDPEDRSSILDQLSREDWNPLLVEEPAGYIYTPHHHAEAKLIVVLEGEMEVTLAGTGLRCRPGDELTIPGGMEHAAVMGPDGCSYFWSERLRSDQNA